MTIIFSFKEFIIIKKAAYDSCNKYFTSNDILQVKHAHNKHTPSHSQCKGRMLGGLFWTVIVINIDKTRLFIDIC